MFSGIMMGKERSGLCGRSSASSGRGARRSRRCGRYHGELSITVSRDKMNRLLPLLIALSLALVACTEEASSPSEPVYLEDTIPPCVPVGGVDVDPCVPRDFYGVQPRAVPGGALDIDTGTTVPYTMRWFLGESIAASLLVVRGTYLPGTVRCAVQRGILGPEWSFGEGGLHLGWPVTKCYADMRVNEYYLGSGPPMLTVLLQSSNQSTDRVGGERKHSDFAGREEIVFLGPSFDYRVEVLQVYERWDVQQVRRGDDSVVAMHPDRHYWLRTTGETHRAVLEMSLSDFATAVTAAQAVRMADFGGRVSEEPNAPMVQTDANKLHGFYVEAGAMEQPGGPPVLPPPP